MFTHAALVSLAVALGVYNVLMAIYLHQRHGRIDMKHLFWKSVVFVATWVISCFILQYLGQEPYFHDMICGMH